MVAAANEEVYCIINLFVLSQLFLKFQYSWAYKQYILFGFVWIVTGCSYCSSLQISLILKCKTYLNFLYFLHLLHQQEASSSQ